MPVIKSAIKAMKQANAAKVRNQATKADFRNAVKIVKKDLVNGAKTVESDLSKAIQAIDKAAKKGVLHKKAADRRKSRLMLAINKSQGKVVESKSIKDPAAKGTKPTTKKAATKVTTKKSTTSKTTKKASK